MIENANASTKIFTHTFDDDDDLRAQTHSEYLFKKKLTQTAKEAQTFLEKNRSTYTCCAEVCWQRFLVLVRSC